MMNLLLIINIIIIKSVGSQAFFNNRFAKQKNLHIFMKDIVILRVNALKRSDSKEQYTI